MAVDLTNPEDFSSRHIGPSDDDIREMLRVVGAGSLDELVAETVPAAIRLPRALELPPPRSEHEILSELRALGARNQIFRSYIGIGFSGCIIPPVIQRCILENPGWYTQYTPYQAEISQGRLEALLNFQTMIVDLTGLEVANASLLDEATACAEAMTMAWSIKDRPEDRAFLVSQRCHPQNIEVVRTRAEPLGIKVLVADVAAFDFAATPVFGVLLQYPASDGLVTDHRETIHRAHEHDALAIMAADPLALVMLTPPGELGADIAVGSTQRFGIPLGYGGPSAAYMATRLENVRKMPGRIIGLSQDANGKPALRMALQTREQHIRREKATSNICTAQVLLAVMASMYAVHHGPQGLRGIARRVHALAAVLALGLERLGLSATHKTFFDTVRVHAKSGAEAEGWMAAARARRMNLRRIDERSVGISLDETTTPADVEELLAVLAPAGRKPASSTELATAAASAIPPTLARTSSFLEHPVFHRYHSEMEMTRYIKRLEERDLSLTRSMIPLGSCTMKLNATVEMMPISWPEWANMHPFAPAEQAAGYQAIFREMEAILGEITGLPGVSFQPNAGSQGEYAGLQVIRRFHHDRGQGGRRVCLIPASAHGTNPASAAMNGFEVVVVACDDRGNIDVADLERKATQHADQLAAVMITYPSTHGVFEEEIRHMCAIVHQHGGQVYMDGANMNAQVGLTRPADVGADVCHINLHKTFAIPHGGGGPGMGPICVAAHLAPFLPRHPLARTGGEAGIGPVSAGPWGSANIVLISWAYCSLMGAAGLTRATSVAILNANYVARRLASMYPTFYTGARGRVAHECILDMRHLKKMAGVEVEDVAKRLMDYGFHAPTMSFPIPNTLMVEPTESESKSELDRFCEAMAAIWEEVKEIESGAVPREGNVLKNAPHTAGVIAAAEWNRPYSREKAAFPVPAVAENKFWPHVGRVNNVLGDRQLKATLPR